MHKCEISEDFFPFNCLVCEKDYYPDNGECKEVLTDNLIKDCLINDSAETCSKCTPETVLSKDKKECYNKPDIISEIDPNCQISKIVSPYCNVCNKGFIMGEDRSC